MKQASSHYIGMSHSKQTKEKCNKDGKNQFWRVIIAIEKGSFTSKSRQFNEFRV